MINFGTVRPGRTLYVPFESFASSTGAPITMTNFAVGDIQIYKDGGTTQRASTSGFTLLDTDGTDFDGITGLHGFSIDLSDNTTADFYQAGSWYMVGVSTVTVDSQTMSFWAATFRIGYQDSTLDTFIATLSSQTSFTLNSGPAEDSALVGRWVCIHDAASAVQQAWSVISAYTGSTKTVTLAAAPTFTIAAKDNISIMGPVPLQPTVLGRTLDVSATGEAGVDWANVGSPTTTLNLSGTTVSAVSGAVGSVTGAVGSVTGNVGGNVTGSVASVTGNVGGNVIGTVGGFNATAEDQILTQTGLALTDYDTGGGVAKQTSLTTALNRIGAFAGSGVNTVLGFLKAALSKTATTPSDVGGTFDPATDSTEAIRDRGDAAWTGGGSGGGGGNVIQ